MNNTIEPITIEPQAYCIEENLQNVNSEDEQSFIADVTDMAVDDALE